MNVSAFVWLGLMVLFLILEANTVSVVSLWFAIGALAAAIAGALGATIPVQIILFLAVSCVLLAALRPIVRKYFTPKLTKTNVDAILGKQGRITEAIENVDGAGRVKIGGMEWAARSQSGEPIPAGTLVQVDRVEGVKVFVSPAEKSVAVK